MLKGADWRAENIKFWCMHKSMSQNKSGIFYYKLSVNQVSLFPMMPKLVIYVIKDMRMLWFQLLTEVCLSLKTAVKCYVWDSILDDFLQKGLRRTWYKKFGYVGKRFGYLFRFQIKVSIFKSGLEVGQVENWTYWLPLLIPPCTRCPFLSHLYPLCIPTNKATNTILTVMIDRNIYRFI